MLIPDMLLWISTIAWEQETDSLWLGRKSAGRKRTGRYCRPRLCDGALYGFLWNARDGVSILYSWFGDECLQKRHPNGRRVWWDKKKCCADLDEVPARTKICLSFPVRCRTPVYRITDKALEPLFILKKGKYDIKYEELGRFMTREMKTMKCLMWTGSLPCRSITW